MNWIQRTNVIQQDELCVVYNAYWKTWSRVLFVDKEQAHFVEVNLTPVNPTMEKSWMNQVYPILIRMHSTRMVAGDHMHRHVVKSVNSRVYNEVKKAMIGRVAIELMWRLLNEDFLENIDWNKYEAMRKSPSYYGGGVPFALIKRSPI